MMTEHTEECKKHKAIFGSVGCTCNSTGEKKLDIPREKDRIFKMIESNLCKYFVSNDAGDIRTTKEWEDFKGG